MPQRDEKGFEERRRQIMDGALDVFAKKGFDGATNRDIATAAGINSPGLIYHYFADKFELFRETVEARIPLLQLLAHPEEILPLPPREALTRFGRAYFQILDNPQATSLMKVVISEAIRHPKIAQVFNELGPNRALGFLAQYLSAKMDEGLLRRQDPQVAARSFAGPLIIFVLQRVVFDNPRVLREDPAYVLAESVDIFLKGMERQG